MEKIIYDLIIIGGGPAAHTAAIYSSRGSLSTLLFGGSEMPGGQLTQTTDVENFPSFPDGVLGMKMMDDIAKQSKKFGTIVSNETVSQIEGESGDFKVFTNEGKRYLSKTIIIATGATPRRLDCKGSNEFWQKGISTCAICDGSLPIFKNKEIVVVGGGDSACEEALYLSKHASHVTMVIRGDRFRASSIMQKRVLKEDKISIVWNSVVSEIKGDKLVRTVEIMDLQTKGRYDLTCSGVFVAIGHLPNTEFLKGFVDLDSEGYLKVSSDLSTNKSGVYAAGDCQDRIYRQAITAAASGCMAALEVQKYLNKV